MSSEYLDSAYSQIREIIQRLQSPIQDLPTLYALLTPPLAYLNILPPQFYRFSKKPLPEHGFNLAKNVPLLQRALLEHVLPAWGPLLDQEDAFLIVQQYFAPDLFSFVGSAAREIAVFAYSTVLSLPLTEYSIRLLVVLVKHYHVNVLWDTIVRGRRDSGLNKHAVSWEDCVKDLCSVPSKVANAFGAHLKGINFPRELEFGTYFSGMSIRFEVLLSSVQGELSQNDISSLSYLLAKLANIGVFPPTKPSSPAQPSFWQAVLPSARPSLSLAHPRTAWCSLLSALPSTITLHTILVSLSSHLELDPLSPDELNGSKDARGIIKRESVILRGLLGPLEQDNDISDAVLSVILNRQWSIGHARVFVAWAAGADAEKYNFKGLQLLLDRVVDVWTATDHVKHSLLAHHHYMTALMLLTLSYFTKYSTNLGPNKLASSPAFVRSISTYISHLDASVRRCGMLVAEEVARMCGKNLDFGDWEGDHDGRAWCRGLRELIGQRDIDSVVAFESVQRAAPTSSESISTSHGRSEEKIPPIVEIPKNEPDSDDDSLVGYASSDASSEPRSPRFTPAELEEIEKDPTLNVGRPKVPRPVYLGQLGELVRPTSGVKSEEENVQVVRMEVALDTGEELIRRKRAYGTELEENAINLTYGFAALQDNYDIKDFAGKRQAALIALVACCPKKVAPALIEQFFMNQYSAEQRYAMLNALALGARELASLSVPGPTVDTKRITFPSKRLPTPLHQRYITAVDEHAANPVQNLLEGITRKAIESGRAAAEEKVPQIVRERKLRLKKPTKVTEMNSSTAPLVKGMHSMQLQPHPVVAFTEVAAEFFICPMINRFWQFLRDEQAREARTAHQPEMHRYRGTGTGLVLNTFVLAQLVATLAVLVHAAHNAPEWLAVLAPDALELAVTLGSKPLSQGEGLEDGDEEEGGGLDAGSGRGGKDAALLTNCLELATVVVDGALELDDGKSFALEHAALLLGAGEWGSEILSRLEKGMKIMGGGGKQEMQLKRAAAGLVLKIDEVTSRWKRSMVAIGFSIL